MTSAWGGHGALVRLRLAAGRVLHGAVGGIGAGVGEGKDRFGVWSHLFMFSVGTWEAFGDCVFGACCHGLPPGSSMEIPT